MPVLEEIKMSDVANQYVNRYTDAFKTTRLAISACVVMAIACLLTAASGIYREHSIRDWRPLVYRIDEHHKAVAENYSQVAESWNKEDARTDVESFLTYYYGRQRSTIASETFGFPRALWYMNEKMESHVRLQDRNVNKGACEDGGIEACTTATFVSDLQAPDVTVQIDATRIEGFKPGGKWQATTTFWLQREFAGNVKRALCIATVMAEYLEKVPSEYLPANRNPRGLIIDSLVLEEGYWQ